MAMQGVLPGSRDGSPVGRGVTPAEVGGQWRESYVYWSGTEYAPNTDNAWNFNTNNGNQNNDNKDNNNYAWAVRPGG